MAAAKSAKEPERFGDIVVVGGGCYGAFYVRQLGRAAAAGAVTWERLLVVDKDPACFVAREPGAGVPEHPMPPPRMVIQDWGKFFDGWIPLPAGYARDAIVPSPLMPHLFFEYLARRAAVRGPARTIERVALGDSVGTPWEKTAPDNTSYLSHATWTCPINCIEPHICPHTKGVRDWTMPDTLAVWVELQRSEGKPLVGPFTFQCTHRAYGVGMVDKEPIRRADEAIRVAEESGPVRALIATTSHCHGAAAVLSIGPEVGSGEDLETSATIYEIPRRPRRRNWRPRRKRNQ